MVAVQIQREVIAVGLQITPLHDVDRISALTARADACNAVIVALNEEIITLRESDA
jgi:hypothetical protein